MASLRSWWRTVQQKPSQWVLGGILPVLFLSSFLTYPQRQPEGITGCITWDTQGYLLYLTGLIHCDLAQHAYADDNPYARHYLHAQSNGSRVIQYWMGYALLMAPGYAIAHLVALWTDYPANGFSPPYHIAVYLSCWLYLALALWVLRRVLLTYFDERVTALTLLCLLLGTNVLFLSLGGITQVHIPLMLPIALLAWQIPRWHRDPTRLRSISLGVVLGLTMLTRPTEGLTGVLVLLFGVSLKGGMGTQVRWMWRHRAAAGCITGALILTLLPQSLYWWLVAGKPWLHSYGAHNTFHWTAPHLLEGLFSYRKGWLLYTPLMGVTLLGIGLLRHTGWQLALAVYAALNLYVIFCWHMWWYTFGVGMRAVVQMYPLLALGLAATLSWIRARNLYWRGLAGMLIAAAIGLNVFQVWQYYHFILPKDGISRLYYWQTFGQTRMDYRWMKYRDLDQRHDGPWGALAGKQTFAAPGELSSPAREYSSVLAIPAGKEPLQGGDWVRVLAITEYTDDAFDDESNARLVTQLTGAPATPPLWAGVRIQPSTRPGIRDSLWYEVQLPREVQPGDSLKLYIWNRGGLLRLHSLAIFRVETE
ncbi:MAG: hypothetical protein KF690_04870 [Bacteroidetes bacterium]|nr:hypothetical protein [Bacteroidota bacterium]